MLIDKRHRGWIATTLLLGVAALLLYLAGTTNHPDDRRGGSLIGLWYGIIGSGLMLYAGLLSALRKVPSWWWLGARKTWLKGHIWLGLLSAVFLLCHSGFSWGNGLEVALWVVVLLTLLTGVLGLALQQIIPRLMTARFPAEAPYEQLPHLCRVLRHKADEEVAKILADPALGENARQEIGRFHRDELRPFLVERYDRTASLAQALRAEFIFANLRDLATEDGVKKALSLLESYCDERRQWGEQERFQFLLHSWLLLHVPLSVLVLVLGTAHVIASLYY